ncbi:MAG TPA: DUF4893 domain-containing protein [Sphingomicrobium sp.]|nr:DUF4893 domain-containing protein [Sphingomicrobium sp.]
MRAAFLAAALLGCSSCNVLEQPSGLIPRWTTAWKEVATGDDRQRLADWRTNLVSALDAARKSGHAADVAREGVLLEPDAALGPPGLPDGIYRCRVIKLGAKTDSGGLPYVSYPPFTCRVKPDRSLRRFNKLDGSQRYVGLIFPGDPIRQVFLGTLVLGDETRALQYGQDQLRDVAGYVERIGPNRWRILMPKPHFESQFDVMELTPPAG